MYATEQQRQRYLVEFTVNDESPIPVEVVPHEDSTRADMGAVPTDKISESCGHTLFCKRHTNDA